VVSFTNLPLYPLGTHWIGGRVRPRSRSEQRREEKILDPTWTRTPTPRWPSPSPVAIPTTLSRLLQPHTKYITKTNPTAHTKAEKHTEKYFIYIHQCVSTYATQLYRTQKLQTPTISRNSYADQSPIHIKKHFARPKTYEANLHQIIFTLNTPSYHIVD
jgi:hypothetical protein